MDDQDGAEVSADDQDDPDDEEESEDDDEDSDDEEASAAGSVVSEELGSSGVIEDIAIEGLTASRRASWR